MLRGRIAARPRPPATVRDLEIALLEEWNSIPQSLIDNLIASMAKRNAGVMRKRESQSNARLSSGGGVEVILEMSIRSAAFEKERKIYKSRDSSCNARPCS
ncbi:hypothetical protein TNCV_3602181 [Trichonephila clavipes]|nr:hypothetical protein TNCV_3602181 [Trichonephila clavipes]